MLRSQSTRESKSPLERGGKSTTPNSPNHAQFANVEAKPGNRPNRDGCQASFFEVGLSVPKQYLPCQPPNLYST